MGMLAHDLRQPLNAIWMASHALSKTESLPEKGGGFVSLQLRAVGRMQRMIAELLDFTRSRPESGMPIQRQPVDFESIVLAALEEIRLAHPHAKLSVEVRGPCLGHWDPDRLAQVCSNLFGNAIEHAPPASTVEVLLIARDSQAELHVTNAGPVIPEELLTTLFQPFRRGLSVKQHGGGVGLGLHIVEQIVHAHGGAISVRSENSTTVFVVTLPREAAVPPSTRLQR
jgi:signal transduction histidine kinase